MNYRAILKVYRLERELNSDETAFLNTLRRMSDTERELTVEALSPAAPKRATKKPASKGASKSRRATSLAGVIGGTAKGFCVYRIALGTTCNETESNPIHDPATGYAGYHEFQPATAQAASGSA